MKLTQIAVGTATFIVLAAQSAAAQTTPAQPEQPAPAQAAPPPPLAPPPPGAPPAAGPPAAPAEGPSAGGPPATARPAVVYTTVNLRQARGTTNNIIAKIPAGSPIGVGNCSGQWCQVTWRGQNGYVIATSLAPGGPPPGYAVPPPGYGPPPVYVGPPPYYGPYQYGYYGPGPYWGRGWHRHW
jgi:hypothetical protein